MNLVKVYSDASIGILFDAVSVLDVSLGIDFSVATTDTTALTSISLPEPGTSFANTIGNVFQLAYVDINGSVSYFPSDDPAANSTFSASAVPEPSSFLAILLVTFPATLRRRK